MNGLLREALFLKDFLDTDTKTTVTICKKNLAILKLEKIKTSLEAVLSAQLDPDEKSTMALRLFQEALDVIEPLGCIGSKYLKYRKETVIKVLDNIKTQQPHYLYQTIKKIHRLTPEQMQQKVMTEFDLLYKRIKWFRDLSIKRRDLLFNYVVQNFKYPVKWQLNDPLHKHNKKWVELFSKVWSPSNHRAKAAFKEHFEMKIMPLKISLEYVLCAECQRLVRRAVVTSDFEQCAKRAAQLMLELSLIPEDEPQIREFVQGLAKNEFSITPIWQTTNVFQKIFLIFKVLLKTAKQKRSLLARRRKFA